MMCGERMSEWKQCRGGSREWRKWRVRGDSCKSVETRRRNVFCGKANRRGVESQLSGTDIGYDVRIEELVKWCERQQQRDVGAVRFVRQDATSTPVLSAVGLNEGNETSSIVGVCNRNVREGEVLLFLSGSVVATAADAIKSLLWIMGSSTSSDDAEGANVGGIDPLLDQLSQIDEHVVLAFFITLERYKMSSASSDSSPNGNYWHKVLDCLLPNYFFPLIWTQEEKELLTGSPMYDQYKKRAELLEDAHKAIIGSIRRIGEACSAKNIQLKTEDLVDWITMDEFTQSFALAIKNSYYLNSAECLAINPLISIVSSAANNNDSTYYESLEYSEKDDAVVIIASRSYKAGEQVNIDFDENKKSLTTGEMIWTFGDILPTRNSCSGGVLDFNKYSNEADYLEYKVSILDSDSLFRAKKTILQEEEILRDNILDDGKSMTFPIFVDRMPEQLLTFLRLSRIQDAAELAMINFNPSSQSNKIVSTANEYEILMLMMAECRERLGAYKSSDVDDETRLINDLSSNTLTVEQTRKLLACILRKQEKLILMSTMNAVRQKLLPVRGLTPTKTGMKDVNDDIIEIFDMIEDIPNMPRKFFESLFRED